MTSEIDRGEQSPNNERKFNGVVDPNLRGVLERFNEKLPESKFFTHAEIGTMIFTSSRNHPTPTEVKILEEQARENGVIPFRAEQAPNPRYLQTREEVLAIAALTWQTRYSGFTLDPDNLEIVEDLIQKLGHDSLAELIKKDSEPREGTPLHLGRQSVRTRFMERGYISKDPDWDTIENFQFDEFDKEEHEARTTETKEEVTPVTYLSKISDENVAQVSDWTLGTIQGKRDLMSMRDRFQTPSSRDISPGALRALVVLSELNEKTYGDPDKIIDKITNQEVALLLKIPEAYLTQFPSIKNMDQLLKAIKRKLTADSKK